MSDDLEGVEYGLPKAAEEPRPWRRSVQGKSPRFPKALTYVAAAAVVVLALVLLLSGVVPPPAPAQTTRPVWNGRLADVTGDDVLYRLEVTQAALKREMAAIGELLSEDGVPLPEDAEMTLVLARLSARQDHLDALVSRLEAGQARLLEAAEVFRLEFSAQAQQLSQLGKMLEAHLAEERN